MVESGRPQMTMRIACWVTKATDTLGIIILISFYGKDGYANVSRFYVFTYMVCLIIDSVRTAQ